MKTYELNDFVPKLEHIIAREICRSTLEQICHKQRLSHAGIMSIDILLMFKNIVLQAICKLCFEQKALQIRDRLSFRDILDLEFADTLPVCNLIYNLDCVVSILTKKEEGMS